nr:amidohydrolase family protein [Shewanella aestuarii]
MLGIWKLAKKYNVPTYTHIQNLSMLEPNSGTKNIIEMIGLAAATGAKTHICHLNSVSLRDIPLISNLVKTAQSSGIPITTEAYAYGAGNGPIGAHEFDPTDVRERLHIDWSDLTAIKTMKNFESKEEVVNARKEDPNLSTIIHYLREDENTHDASLLDMSVLLPGGAIVTDGLPYITSDGKFFNTDEWPLPEGLSNHPRAAGNYCRFLRKWVRERGVISWMAAIRQASLNAALILEDSIPEMKRKGRLQVGADADILVFDPNTVSEQADFRNPARLSTGMHHVLVNGKFLIRDEELDTNALPGKPIRGKITA